jgi:carbon-monoxide dehydrogenase large subunit
VQLGDRLAARDMFSKAAHVVRREFRNSRIVNSQMEPCAAIGMYDAALQAPAEKVRVVCPDVGGGFGPRNMFYAEQLSVAWEARHVGRPVEWTGDRSEAFLSDYQGRDAITRAAIAFDADGRMLAIDNEWIGNVGAHTVSYVPMSNGSRVMTTVYHVPVAAVHISAVLTNTVPTGPYRGAGRPEANHMMERMLDIAAREMNIDRVEIRRRNLVPRSALPYRSPMGLNYDSGDFEGNMDRALALADWSGFEAPRAASLARGRPRGIGLANYIEAPVGAPRERIEMTVLPEGVIDIVSGTQTQGQGQGHATTFAQVIASQLGVSVDAVRLRTGDTDFVSVGGDSHSDRSMRLGGTLLVQASAQLIETARPVAAALLGVQEERIEFADGAFRDRQSSAAATIFDVARRMAAHGTPSDPALTALHAAAEMNGRISAHPTGAAICELEVDPETGDVALLHYASVDDVGQPINPLIVEGQVHGGLAQDIGQAFSEGYYIESGSGQVLSGSYMDYGVTRAGCVPPLSIEFSEDPTSGNPLRVKGGGESGITPATAVIFNALADALRDIGTDELPMPAMPAAIWSFMHRAEETGT